MNNVLNKLKEIASLVMMAAEGETLEDVLQRIAHVSRELANARYAALGVPDGVGGLQYFKVSGISAEEIARIPHLPEGRGLLGKIMNERTSLRLDNMRDHAEAVGFPENHPHMTSLLGVPIQVGQQLFGMLYLSDRLDGKPFDENDQWIIETMAGYAALAIAGVQIREQRSRLTVLEERERISMELHDGVIQSLYAVGMQIEIMRGDDTIDPDMLLPVIQSLNTVIEDIRSYILDLKSTNGTRKTIREYLDESISRLHIPNQMTLTMDVPDHKPPFSPSTFTAITLIVAEAVSNAVRHANADNIHLSTHQANGTFTIEVADDGTGFDPNSLGNHQGLGLRNIQERANLHNGFAKITSEPGQGTRITIELPVHGR